MARKLKIPRRRRAKVPPAAQVARHRRSREPSRRSYEGRHRVQQSTYRGRHRADDEDRYIRPNPPMGPYGQRLTPADDRRGGRSGGVYRSSNR